jgi:hypothetical protein
MSRSDQAGYSLAHDDEYAKLKLSVVEEGLFRVEAFANFGITSVTEGSGAWA